MERKRGGVLMMSVCLALAGGLPVQAASWQQVAQKYSRCENQLKRCERMSGRLSDRMRSVASVRREESSVDIKEFSSRMAGKSEMVLSRIERIKNMSDKIHQDIEKGNTGGGGCPQCVVSSVKLFCRQVDAVDAELTGLLGEAAEFRNEITAGIGLDQLIRTNAKRLNAFRIHSAYNPDVKEKMSGIKELHQQSVKNRDLGKNHSALTEAQKVSAGLMELEETSDISEDTVSLDKLMTEAQRRCTNHQGSTAEKILHKAREHYKAYMAFLDDGAEKEASREEIVIRALIDEVFLQLSSETTDK